AIGQCDLETREFASAEKMFAKSIELRPEATAVSGLVYVVLMQGRKDEARKLLGDAITKYGSTASLLRVQGDLALVDRRSQEALGFYRESLAKSPTQPDLVERVRDLQEFLTSAPQGVN